MPNLRPSASSGLKSINYGQKLNFRTKVTNFLSIFVKANCKKSKPVIVNVFTWNKYNLIVKHWKYSRFRQFSLLKKSICNNIGMFNPYVKAIPSCWSRGWLYCITNLPNAFFYSSWLITQVLLIELKKLFWSYVCRFCS